MFVQNTMRQSIFITLLLSCFTPCLSFAQNTSTFVDLGLVRGEYRQITQTFYWKNNLNRAVSFVLDSPDTALRYDSRLQQVDKGATATIQVEMRLPQKFGYYVYTLDLMDTARFKVHTFQLGAQVLAAPQDVFGTYDETHWPFKSKHKVYNLGIGRVGDTLRKTFDVYNFGGQTFHFTPINASDTLFFNFKPTKIEHHHFGKLSISYVPTDTANYGYSKVVVPLLVKGEVESYFPVQYTVLPKEDSSGTAGPRIELDKNSYDFREVQSGKVVSALFQITNSGDEQLNILKVQSNCECLSYQLPQYDVDPNQTVELVVFFDTTNRRGFEKKTLALFSNDVMHSTQVIDFQISVR